MTRAIFLQVTSVAKLKIPKLLGGEVLASPRSLALN